MKKNIETVRDSKACCGCENCSNICPKNAIIIQHDKEGFKYPVVDSNKCVACGLCLLSCPVEHLRKEEKHSEIVQIFATYINSPDNLIKSSSGGMGYCLMNYCLRNGIHSFGVSYSENYTRAKYIEIKDREDIQACLGAKYIQAKKNDCFKIIEKYLIDSEKVLFIGLPCEVAALKVFLKTDYKNLFTVELICHGPTSDYAAEQFIQRISGKRFLKSFTIKHKKKGWTPGYIRAVYEDGHVFSKIFDSTEYGFAFRNFSRPSCYSCHFRGHNSFADITIGDYWGASEKDPCWNRDGVSLVLIHSDKGINMFNKLTEMIAFPIDYDHAIVGNSTIYKSRSKGIRDKYSKDFVLYGSAKARKINETYKEYFIRVLRDAYYFVK